jgi:hypothetical protein
VPFRRVVIDHLSIGVEGADDFAISLEYGELRAAGGRPR